MKRIPLFVVALAAAVTSNSVGAADSKQLKRFLAMTPESYASATTVKDDRLETVVTFDTQEAFKEKFGLLGIVWSDVFLRAFLDKQSGEAKFQIYASLRMQALTWPHFERVNFEGPVGVISKEVERLGSDVDCSMQSIYNKCAYREVVAFTIEEDALRRIAALYTPNGRSGFTMRFKGQSGQDADMIIMPAEAAGLLQVVDSRRPAREERSKPTTKSPPPG